MSQPIVSEARVFNKPQFYYKKTAKVELSPTNRDANFQRHFGRPHAFVH